MCEGPATLILPGAMLPALLHLTGQVQTHQGAERAPRLPQGGSWGQGGEKAAACQFPCRRREVKAESEFAGKGRRNSMGKGTELLNSVVLGVSRRQHVSRGHRGWGCTERP